MRADRMIHRWRVAIGVIAVALPCAFFALGGATRNDPRIARIRTWFLAAEKALPGNRVVRKELGEFSSEGGALTAYFAGDSLSKLDANLYVDEGRVTYDFYMHDDSTYFVSHIIGKYSLSMDGRIIHRVQYRMYFDHDTLIRWIDTTGKELPVQGQAADDEASKDLTMGRILMACAKLADPSAACLAPSNDSTPQLAK
ncbi:MAG: hypothetical protein ABI446_07395 [Gemmatimonadaceae bacterium]